MVSFQPVNASALGEGRGFTFVVFAEGCDIPVGVDQTGVTGCFADLDPEAVHFSRAIIAVDVSPMQSGDLRAPVDVPSKNRAALVGAVLHHRG